MEGWCSSGWRWAWNLIIKSISLAPFDLNYIHKSLEPSAPPHFHPERFPSIESAANVYDRNQPSDILFHSFSTSNGMERRMEGGSCIESISPIVFSVCLWMEDQSTRVWHRFIYSGLDLSDEWVGYWVALGKSSKELELVNVRDKRCWDWGTVSQGCVS